MVCEVTGGGGGATMGSLESPEVTMGSLESPGVAGVTGGRWSHRGVAGGSSWSNPVLTVILSYDPKKLQSCDQLAYLRH